MNDKKKQKPKKVKLKEIRIRPRIGEHDLNVKLRAARKFIDKGHQVRITVMYRGREAAVSRTLAEEKLNRFLELGKPTSKPKWSNNRYSVVIA